MEDHIPKHRRSIRLPGYDYTQAGAYFITICTFQTTAIFGKIFEDDFHSTQAGRIAQEEWERLPGRFPNLGLGAFVVMPNHIHGIVILNDTETRTGTASTTTESIMELTRRAPTSERFGHPISGSIPTIVRSYKSSVTLRINRLCEHPDHQVWQRNYYEHIIRDEVDHQRIHAYILNNPQRWTEDRFHPR